MDPRSKKILRIRPVFFLPAGTEITEDQRFLFMVLKPLLQFQNKLLLGSFTAHLKEQNIDFDVLDQKTRQVFIEKELKNNPALTNRLIGMLVGQFTSDEFEYFQENKKRLEKLIVGYIENRLLEELQTLTDTPTVPI